MTGRPPDSVTQVRRPTLSSEEEVSVMRVLLIEAPVANPTPHSRLSPPLGLAYVAQHLLDHGHDVELIDLNLTGLNPIRITATLNRFRPEIVGISAHTETYPGALQVARLVKRHDGSVPVMMGGPHVSILPLEALAEPVVDYVAIGEGELTAVELLEALAAGSPSEKIREIAGLGHKANGSPVSNATRAPLELGLLGRPARDLLSLDFYEDAYNVLASRGGCPYRCPFCSASQLWGGKRRPRPVADIMAEVAEVVERYGARHVFLVDDILTVNRIWFDELLTALEGFGGEVTWGCATRVDCVDEALLKRMAAAGFSAIQFGIESGSQAILDSVKGIDKRAAHDAVRWATSAGITAACSFMVPFPDDTKETLSETFEFMRTLRGAGGQLLVSYTTPYPGTMFFNDAEKLGLKILTRDWGRYDAKQLVLETSRLSAREIEALTTSAALSLGLRRSA